MIDHTIATGRSDHSLKHLSIHLVDEYSEKRSTGHIHHHHHIDSAHSTGRGTFVDFVASQVAVWHWLGLNHVPSRPIRQRPATRKPWPTSSRCNSSIKRRRFRLRIWIRSSISHCQSQHPAITICSAISRSTPILAHDAVGLRQRSFVRLKLGQCSRV